MAEHMAAGEHFDGRNTEILRETDADPKKEKQTPPKTPWTPPVAPLGGSVDIIDDVFDLPDFNPTDN